METVSRVGDHQQTPVAAIDRRAIPAAAREGVWTAADGWQVRRIDWPVPDHPRGSILFLPGRGDAYEKYLETLEQWHRRGWLVTAADWRGQAGSGRLGTDGVTGHIDDFATWVHDLSALWADWSAQAPGPHVLAAHSMGGQVALRAVAEKKVAPDAVVLSAPMLGLHGYGLPYAALHGAARAMCALGDPRRPAWKWSEKPGQVPVERIRLLTHDQARYDDELYWRDARGELVMGPGSWGWVERAYASIRLLNRPGMLEGVQVPVLILSTSADTLVSHAANVAAARRLPKGELVAFGQECRHELLREVDRVRDKAMAAIDEFLDRVAARPN